MSTSSQFLSKEAFDAVWPVFSRRFHRLVRLGLIVSKPETAKSQVAAWERRPLADYAELQSMVGDRQDQLSDVYSAEILPPTIKLAVDATGRVSAELVIIIRTPSLLRPWMGHDEIQVSMNATFGFSESGDSAVLVTLPSTKWCSEADELIDLDQTGVKVHGWQAWYRKVQTRSINRTFASLKQFPTEVVVPAVKLKYKFLVGAGTYEEMTGNELAAIASGKHASSDLELNEYLAVNKLWWPHQQGELSESLPALLRHSEGLPTLRMNPQAVPVWKVAGKLVSENETLGTGVYGGLLQVTRCARVHSRLLFDVNGFLYDNLGELYWAWHMVVLDALLRGPSILLSGQLALMTPRHLELGSVSIGGALFPSVEPLPLAKCFIPLSNRSWQLSWFGMRLTSAPSNQWRSKVQVTKMGIGNVGLSSAFAVPDMIACVGKWTSGMNVNGFLFNGVLIKRSPLVLDSGSKGPGLDIEFGPSRCTVMPQSNENSKDGLNLWYSCVVGKEVEAGPMSVSANATLLSQSEFPTNLDHVSVVASCCPDVDELVVAASPDIIGEADEKPTAFIGMPIDWFGAILEPIVSRVADAFCQGVANAFPDAVAEVERIETELKFLSPGSSEHANRAQELTVAKQSLSSASKFRTSGLEFFGGGYKGGSVGPIDLEAVPGSDILVGEYDVTHLDTTNNGVVQRAELHFSYKCIFGDIVLQVEQYGKVKGATATLSFDIHVGLRWNPVTGMPQHEGVFGKIYVAPYEPNGIGAVALAQELNIKDSDYVQNSNLDYDLFGFIVDGNGDFYISQAIDFEVAKASDSTNWLVGELSLGADAPVSAMMSALSDALRPVVNAWWSEISCLTPFSSDTLGHTFRDFVVLGQGTVRAIESGQFIRYEMAKDGLAFWKLAANSGGQGQATAVPLMQFDESDISVAVVTKYQPGSVGGPGGSGMKDMLLEIAILDKGFARKVNRMLLLGADIEVECTGTARMNSQETELGAFPIVGLKILVAVSDFAKSSVVVGQIKVGQVGGESWGVLNLAISMSLKSRPMKVLSAVESADYSKSYPQALWPMEKYLPAQKMGVFPYSRAYSTFGKALVVTLEHVVAASTG